MTNDSIPVVPRVSFIRPDRKVLEFLVCPVTRGPLVYDAERGELVSASAGLAFPVRDGIAIMLVSEARSVDCDGSGSAENV